MGGSDHRPAAGFVIATPATNRWPPAKGVHGLFDGLYGEEQRDA